MENNVENMITDIKEMSLTPDQKICVGSRLMMESFSLMFGGMAGKLPLDEVVVDGNGSGSDVEPVVKAGTGEIENPEEKMTASSHQKGKKENNSERNAGEKTGAEKENKDSMNQDQTNSEIMKPEKITLSSLEKAVKDTHGILKARMVENGSALIREELLKLGASKLHELPEDRYPEFLEALHKLQRGDQDAG